MRRSLSQLAGIALVVAGFPILAHAQAGKPQFSGTWVLDAAKSTTGPGVPPALTMEITQQETAVSIHRVVETPNGPSEASLRYNTDGSPSTNQVKQGPMQFEAKSIVTWQADVLAFDTKIQAGEQEVLQKERWTLSADGRTLTISRVLTVNGQELPATLVLAKKQA